MHVMDGTGAAEGEGRGPRRSGRALTRADAQRLEGVEERREAERVQRRERARAGEERVQGRARGREGRRAAVAEKIEEMARAGGWRLERELREVGGVGRIKERWRWSFTPAGAREQLVLFYHGERDGLADQEVRAAILESEYGRGLYYACDASHGRELGFYDGEVVTRTEYLDLDVYTGL